MHNAELIRLKDEYDCIMVQMLEQHQKEIASIKMNTLNTDKKNQEIAYIETSENTIVEER